MYSIIGTFDSAKQALYRGIDGKIQFRLEYDNQDTTQSILIWKQSNWLLDNIITDSEYIELTPSQTVETTDCAYFSGLVFNVNYKTLIAGTYADGCWYVHFLISINKNLI